MSNLLQKLLAYSRVNQSPVLTNVKLSAAVHATLFKLTASIKESSATIRFDDLPEIPAHEIQVCQLFEQIITNSILYRGSRKPEIEISAEEGELDGSPAHIISIKDNGMGIEEQYLTQVIQPFKRLHGKDYPGNGLGLAICDKIMRAHQGRLWIESDGSSWTRVCAAFPC
jgi:light-regulated signal transduction histidine kinase (bacteriophytochrome)